MQKQKISFLNLTTAIMFFFAMAIIAMSIAGIVGLLVLPLFYIPFFVLGGHRLYFGIGDNSEANARRDEQAQRRIDRMYANNRAMNSD